MEKEQYQVEHSKLNMASYGAGKALSEFIQMAFSTFVFYYYEKEIGLNPWLTAIGFFIFAVWNAINDPLVGHLTNRPFKFTKKWGRRFPWVIIGGIPWLLSYLLIFLPPSTNATTDSLLIFGWLVLATCIFDTFFSIWWIGFAALFPDKFRSLEERRTVQAIATPIGIIGIALGFILPPLIIERGDLVSYVIQAGVMIIGGLVILSASLPGCREDQETIDRYLSKHSDRSERKPFFSMLKEALKQKSFFVFIIAYTLYRGMILTFQASLPYLVDDVLSVPDDYISLFSVGFLLGAFISAPLWIKLTHKVNNNKKVIVSASLFLTIATFPFIFIRELILIFIVITIWGVGLGGFWSLLAPVLADVIDESVAMTGKREEGIYSGYQAFFGRLGIILQAFTFAIVHVLTGYNPDADTQTPLATFGIHIHFALVPMIFMLIATLVLWKWYDLTPEKVEIHQNKIEELKL
ncbi:MAG: putative Na+/melibiose symporter-like transporter [Promethearchaeota archaeon]|nr:MAG: putative Na+/melibiose symporter-like transporter [Candidatus Lokiarchaeota archaeon]